MDRQWMYQKDVNFEEFLQGVRSFLLVAEAHRLAKGTNEIFCPCSKCKNFVGHKNINEIEFHLLQNGFVRKYNIWSEHGESLAAGSSTSVSGSFANENNDSNMNRNPENLKRMFHDMEATTVGDSHQEKLQELFVEAKNDLYDGSKYSKLSAVLELFNLKASNGWSDKSFTSLLKFLKKILPEANTLPISIYEAKKIICPMGLGYQRIAACPNDYMLYRNEYEDLHACVTCGTSRYKKEPDEPFDDVKKNGPPAKVLWYFPIIPRLQRLFASKKEARLMRWHFDERKKDGKIRHVADSPQWRNSNNKFLDFGNEIRNIRFGLSSDGINPFGNMSSRYSTWPVFLCIYNLPPWLCMKRKYIMMSLLISGPKQPGNNIDIYLAPLIDDMKDLWGPGIEVYDAYKNEKFRLRAMIYCTINDFPAYGNLSGYSTKGNYACPVCEDETHSRRLENCKKTVFMGHRRSLPINHLYRNMSLEFDGKTEMITVRKRLDGDYVLARVNIINNVFGKTTPVIQGMWKKRSIFFDLPYWKDLEVRHCLDVMHIEKNVCESLTGVLLNIPGKTKDGVNARKDMVSWGIHLELALVEKDKGHTYLPPTCYTMSKDERAQFCKCLRDIKVPSSYSANIKSLVSMKDCKLQGMKSHDCHVLMTHMIPIALRGLLPEHIRHTITQLCSFFNTIHLKVLDLEVLDSLQSEIILTLCQLEMYMGVLKGYVRNRSRPEGSIVDGYVAEEAAEFCTGYLDGIKSIGVSQSRHLGRLSGAGTIGSKSFNPDYKLFELAHFAVLQHMTCISP
uniref:uncharacterized protein LOC122597363 n=1 Tax=Erigeron canadensis TaxID=72917 RepID=UPI001CB9D098|nr:uncharacterized protein LOC122597363 [Erigeron canadensis]